MWPAVIGAVGSIAGGLLGRAGQQDANRTNLQIWREQRQWSENLANTEVQRRVEDLKKAGINPMLAAMNGASTPSTGMPHMENEETEIARGAASAAQAAIVAKQLNMAEKLNDAQVAATKAQAMKTRAEGEIVAAEVPYAAKTANIKVNRLMSEAKEVLHKAVQAEFSSRYLQPLAFELAKIQKELEEAGLAEAHALEKFWENAGATGKVVDKIVGYIPGASALRDLFRRRAGRKIGTEKSVTRYKDGSTHTQETYDYSPD